MPRIDAHHSFSTRYPLEHLEAILKRNRFEGSILAGPARDVPEFVRGFIVPAGEYSTTVGQASDCQPDEPGVGRLKPAPHQDPRIRAVEVRRLEDLERVPAHLPLDLMEMLEHVPEIAARFPGRPLAIDHLGAPAGEDWPELMEAAAQFPQVCCKLSGLTRFSGPRQYVQYALQLFGPRRLMFASDWPNGLPEYTWKASLALFTQSIGAQTIETREELLGGTAARFYGV